MLAEIRPFNTAARRRRTSADRLREALLELAQGKATILHHAEKNWASVTFAGTRHTVELTFEGAIAVEIGELLIALLPEHEFEILGQLVADATVIEVEHQLEPALLRVRCELLLLEDG